MSRYNRVLVDFLVAAALIAAIIALAFAIFGRPAHGGELIYCSESPRGGDGSYWFYRIIDDRRCWFQSRGLRRGQDKPKEELRWQPKPVVEDPPTVNEEEPARTELIEEADKPLDFDARWDGTKDGKSDRLK